jgi:hypothetical protein
MANFIRFDQSKHIGAYQSQQTRTIAEGRDKSIFKLSPRNEKPQIDIRDSDKLFSKSASDRPNANSPLKSLLPIKQFSMLPRHHSSLRKSSNLAASYDLKLFSTRKQSTLGKTPKSSPFPHFFNRALNTHHDVDGLANRIIPPRIQPRTLASDRSIYKERARLEDMKKLSHTMMEKQRMRAIAMQRKVATLPQPTNLTINAKRFQFYKTRRRMRRSPHRLYEEVSEK